MVSKAHSWPCPVTSLKGPVNSQRSQSQTATWSLVVSEEKFYNSVNVFLFLRRFMLLSYVYLTLQTSKGMVNTRGRKGLSLGEKDIVKVAVLMGSPGQGHEQGHTANLFRGKLKACNSSFQ